MPGKFLSTLAGRCALSGCFFFALLAPYRSATQPYVEGGKTRHRFAQLNFGSDNRVFLAPGAEWYAQGGSGTPERRSLGSRTESRLILGGTHFWGHADFYLAAPVFSFGEKAFTTGSESVFQYFPWRIEHRKIRPYIGVSWLTAYYRQGEGAQLKRFRLPLLAGLVYNRDRHLFELGFGYNYNNRFRYYTSPTEATIIRTQPLWLSFCYKWMFETTINSEKNWENGRTRVRTDSLATAKRLSGLTFSFGPSEAIFLKKSPYNTETAPYADQHVATHIFMDFGVGYYLSRPDVQLHLGYRAYRNRIAAFGYAQEAERRSMVVEGFRFWLDYHGFAAFAGPALSYEWLRVQDSNASGPLASGRYAGLKPGLTFGWDIRPDRLQTYYLRTTLRYFPNLGVTMPGGRQFHFDALELNFIQLVLFPGRLFRGRLAR